MLKIKLKLNISNLNAVLHVLDSYDNDLYSKLLRKAITERKNDKIFAISFKYHEAYALEAILRHFISNADEAYSDPYVKNTAHVIANKIHQEL